MKYVNDSDLFNIYNCLNIKVLSKSISVPKSSVTYVTFSLCIPIHTETLDCVTLQHRVVIYRKYYYVLRLCGGN